MKLNGPNLYLRAVEPEDLEFLYMCENDTSVWEMSNTVAPYSKEALKQYLEVAQYDIYTTKQLRLIICLIDNTPIGAVDLFDFDPTNKRAGVGVLIADGSQRGKGYASEALDILISYAFGTLHLHQLYCNILKDNVPSLRLFESKNFQRIGLKKDWVLSDGNWKDEYLFQLINSNS